VHSWISFESRLAKLNFISGSKDSHLNVQNVLGCQSDKQIAQMLEFTWATCFDLV